LTQAGILIVVIISICTLFVQAYKKK